MSGGRARALPWLLAGATVATQIPYPLTSGGTRAALTVLSVLVFFAASASHAALARGAGWACGFVAVAAGGGLLAETVGVHTGWPFGSYEYGGTLGPALAGVPVVVPLAWAMMGYPALVLGRRCARAAGVASRPAALAVTALVGGATLTTWDLFLDPQMVAEGHWAWSSAGPALNGIPLTNAAGWLLVGTVMTGLLASLPVRRGPDEGVPDERVPLTLLGWTYASSLLANLAFFGRPGVALAGGLGMGVVLAAAAAVDRRGARRAGRRPDAGAARPAGGPGTAGPGTLRKGLL